jgi:TRAP-type C4-dicarboxylate transport system permease small subunit
MSALRTFRNVLERVLVVVSLSLMTVLALIVIAAVVVRTAGASFTWYDEVASIILAWITYYGAALAALRRSHLGFPTIAAMLPPPIRLAVMLVTEAVVIVFFVLVAYFGLQVIDLLRGDTLISLPWVKVEFVQSVIPIGAVLFIIAELTTIPDRIREARTGAPAAEAGHEAEVTQR